MIRWSWFGRIAASVLLLTYSVVCTHLPSGEKAFDSFETCFATNLGLAAVGGVAVGVLGSQLISNKNVGAVAGIVIVSASEDEESLEAPSIGGGAFT